MLFQYKKDVLVDEPPDHTKQRAHTSRPTMGTIVAALVAQRRRGVAVAGTIHHLRSH